MPAIGSGLGATQPVISNDSTRTHARTHTPTPYNVIPPTRRYDRKHEINETLLCLFDRSRRARQVFLFVTKKYGIIIILKNLLSQNTEGRRPCANGNIPISETALRYVIVFEIHEKYFRKKNKQKYIKTMSSVILCS